MRARTRAHTRAHTLLKCLLWLIIIYFSGGLHETSEVLEVFDDVDAADETRDKFAVMLQKSGADNISKIK